MIKSILVAVDGSEHSRKALDMACDLAKRYSASLDILSVAQPSPNAELVWGGTSVTLNSTPGETTKAAQAIVDEAAKLAAAAGVDTVETNVSEKEPASAILDHAKKRGSDVIVMGNRGLSRLKGLLVGSVSNKVTQLATCAVLTVR